MAQPINIEIRLPDRRIVKGNALEITIDEHIDRIRDETVNWTIVLKGTGRLQIIVN